LIDCYCPNIEVIVSGQRVARILIDRGSDINITSMAICRQLGITKWEPYKFKLQMVDGSSVWPIKMIPDLKMVAQEYVFTISIVRMELPNKDMYPLIMRGTDKA
jgi:hypothetical protein